jgi:hypothetical protein
MTNAKNGLLILELAPAVLALFKKSSVENAFQLNRLVLTDNMLMQFLTVLMLIHFAKLLKNGEENVSSVFGDTIIIRLKQNVLK